MAIAMVEPHSQLRSCIPSHLKATSLKASQVARVCVRPHLQTLITREGLPSVNGALLDIRIDEIEIVPLFEPRRRCNLPFA